MVVVAAALVVLVMKLVKVDGVDMAVAVAVEQDQVVPEGLMEIQMELMVPHPDQMELVDWQTLVVVAVLVALVGVAQLIVVEMLGVLA
jgi:hypothetical protein